MASIEVKSRNNGKVYYIVQAIRDENGKRVQKRIRCKSLQEAQALLPDVERANKQNQLYQHPRAVSSFIDLTPVVDVTITVRQLLEEYIEQQARDNKWTASTYHSRTTQARAYIYPYIGDVPIHLLTAYALKKYYDKIQDEPALRGGKISPRTVEELHKLLHPALNYAAVMGYITTNPSDAIKPPKQKSVPQEQWTFDEAQQAFDLCDNVQLRLMLLLHFCATLRSGELVGLQWDCLHLDEPAPYIIVKQTLGRHNRESIKKSKTKVLFEFPMLDASQNTALMLKEPKTKKSTRKVYIPVTLSQELREYERSHKETLRLCGVYDFNMVFSQDNGFPIDTTLYNKRLQKFIQKNGLRLIHANTLRHTGATEKLLLTHDIKAVQGDMGHATADMLLKHYLGMSDQQRQQVAAQMDETLFQAPPTETEIPSQDDK